MKARPDDLADNTLLVEDGVSVPREQVSSALKNLGHEPF